MLHEINIYEAESYTLLHEELMVRSIPIVGSTINVYEDDKSLEDGSPIKYLVKNIEYDYFLVEYDYFFGWFRTNPRTF